MKKQEKVNEITFTLRKSPILSLTHILEWLTKANNHLDLSTDLYPLKGECLLGISEEEDIY